MIKSYFIGNLGKDAEVNQHNERSVINFSVAVTEKVKGESKTTWVECSYWTNSTAVAPYLRKGTKLFVEGKMEIRTYTAKDGSVKSLLSCNVTSVQLLGGSEQASAPQQTVPAQESFINTMPDDGLPF